MFNNYVNFMGVVKLWDCYVKQIWHKPQILLSSPCFVSSLPPALGPHYSLFYQIVQARQMTQRKQWDQRNLINFPDLIGVILRLKWIQSKTQCVNFFKPESKKKLSDGLKSGIDSCRILLGYRAIACKAMSDKQIMQTKPNDKNLGEAHYLEIDKTFQTRLFLFP